MASITRDRVPVSLYTRKGIRVAYLCHETEWVPDSERAACASCATKFHMLNRKHHCRLCGEVVCGTCSRVMSFHASNRVRACLACIRSSLVEFTPNPSAPTDTATTRVVLQTTAHPLYKDDLALASSPSWSRSTAVIYATCLVVLVHVFSGQDITTTISRLLK